MKLEKAEQILRVTSPHDLFDMNLDTIEKQYEEYIECFKPKKYNVIRNAMVTQKISLLYDKALEILNNKTDDSNEVKKTNSEKVNSVFEILNSSAEAFKEVDMIQDTELIKRITDEYYMLLSQIDSIEDKIIQTGTDLTEVYENIIIEKKDIIKVTTEDLQFVTWTNCDNDVLDDEQFEQLKKLVKAFQDSPVEIIRRVCIDCGYDKGDSTSRVIVYGSESDQLLHLGDWEFDYNYNENREKAFEHIRQNFEAHKYYCLSQVNELKQIIAVVNSEIMLNNLRSLHGALFMAYKEIKLNIV